MKSIKLIAFALFASSIAFFSSCNPACDPPSISFNPSTTASSKAVGDTVTFSVTVTTAGDCNIGGIDVYKKIGGAAETALPAITGISGNGHTFTFTYVVENLPASTTVAFRFVAKADDKDETSSELTYTITVTGQGTKLIELTNAQMKVWHVQGPNPGAYDLINSVGKASGDPDTDKDLQDRSVAPNFTPTWYTGTGNLTQFVRNNSFDYANATAGTVTLAYNAGTQTSSVTSIQNGDIILCRLRGGSRYAVIKVNTVTVTPADNLDNITFAYKMTN